MELLILVVSVLIVLSGIYVSIYNTKVSKLVGFSSLDEVIEQMLKIIPDDSRLYDDLKYRPDESLKNYINTLYVLYYLDYKTYDIKPLPTHEQLLETSKQHIEKYKKLDRSNKRIIAIKRAARYPMGKTNKGNRNE